MTLLHLDDVTVKTLTLVFQDVTAEGNGQSVPVSFLKTTSKYLQLSQN